MVSFLGKPIILTLFIASFLLLPSVDSSYLILGFTLIVFFKVRTTTDAIIFYDYTVSGLQELLEVRCILKE